MNNKTFGEVLKMLRKQHNMTQKELAKLLSVSQTPVSRWESGDRDITLSMLQRIARVFNMPLSKLVGMMEE